ncbi:MAG: ABC transporter permease, partial [Mycobacterium sp.]
MVTTSPEHTHHHAEPRHETPPAARAAGVIVALTTVLVILALAFTLPAVHSGPHGVPIGAAGPQAAGGQLATMLEQNAPGAFDVTYYPGGAALTEAIRQRDEYGGIVLPSEPGGQARLLIASAGSPAIAQ